MELECRFTSRFLYQMTFYYVLNTFPFFRPRCHGTGMQIHFKISLSDDFLLCSKYKHLRVRSTLNHIMRLPSTTRSDFTPPTLDVHFQAPRPPLEDKRVPSKGGLYVYLEQL